MDGRSAERARLEADEQEALNAALRKDLGRMVEAKAELEAYVATLRRSQKTLLARLGEAEATVEHLSQDKAELASESAALKVQLQGCQKLQAERDAAVARLHGFESAEAALAGAIARSASVSDEEAAAIAAEGEPAGGEADAGSDGLSGAAAAAVVERLQRRLRQVAGSLVSLRGLIGQAAAEATLAGIHLPSLHGEAAGQPIVGVVGAGERPVPPIAASRPAATAASGPTNVPDSAASSGPASPSAKGTLRLERQRAALNARLRTASAGALSGTDELAHAIGDGVAPAAAVSGAVLPRPPGRSMPAAASVRASGAASTASTATAASQAPEEPSPGMLGYLWAPAGAVLGVVDSFLGLSEDDDEDFAGGDPRLEAIRPAVRM